MPRKRDRFTGKYTTAYEDEAFVAAIEEHGGTAGTSEVADSVGCGRDNAYRRLRQLAEEGEISKRKIGRTMLWGLPED